MSPTATLPLPGHAKAGTVEIASTAPMRRPKPAKAALPAVHTDAGLGKEADLVRRYWKEQEPIPLKPLRVPEGAVLSSLCVGLGDTLMLTDVLRAGREQGRATPVMSTSPHFRPLMRFNPGWREPEVADQGLLVNAASLVRHYDCGNGHYLQRLRRAFGYGLEADCVPRPCVAWQGQRHKNRVVLHFEAGRHALWQRQNISPRARTLFHDTRKELEAFIKSEPTLDFISIGAAPDRQPIKGARHISTPNLSDLVNVVGASAWFIGLVSGPMHLATSLGLRCLVLTDFPAPYKIMLPTLRASRQLESEWLYIQNVHLAQDGEGPLVPKATAKNFKLAMEGRVYPFWRAADYAGLIQERLDP